MEWTRHKGGVHRAEDGTIVRRLDADTFALWRPGASVDDDPLATFPTLDQARAHAEEGELVAAAPAVAEGEPKRTRKRATKTTKGPNMGRTRKGTEHAKGEVRGSTIEARLERAARAAEGQGLDAFADQCRALVGKKPAKTWAGKLRATLPEDRDDKAVKIATRLAGRFEAGLDEEKLLKQVYADAYYLERA